MRKTEHIEKIENAIKTGNGIHYIEKWKHEIESFNNQIRELKRKIGK